MAIQTAIGPASAAMTLNLYAGLFDDELDRVAERLEAAARRRQPPFCHCSPWTQTS
jgi:hypothetical protein